MGKKFKQFFNEELKIHQKSTSSHSQLSMYNWDVILFYGNYNPITRKEYYKIINFLNNFQNYLNEDVSIGLITNEDSKDSSYHFSHHILHNLTLEERNFITTKFFGLKLFGLNLNDIINYFSTKVYIDKENSGLLSKFTRKQIEITQKEEENQKLLHINDPDVYLNATYKNKNNFNQNNSFFKNSNRETEQKNNDFLNDKIIQEKIKSFILEIKNNFYGSNILIVMESEDFVNIQELMEITEFSQNDINLGFMFWDDKLFKSYEEEGYKIFGNFLPFTGDMIKATVLLHNEKPYPEELRYFCHTYNLQHLLDEIRFIHLKMNNENYHLVFDYLFPPIKIYSNTEMDSTHKEDLLFLMGLLYSMYKKT